MAMWYVTPIGTNGTGTLDNPWVGFSNIVWGSIGATDTLYILGTFNEALTVQKSGTSVTQKFTIRGDHPSASGVINGQHTILQLVTITDYDNIDILGCTITGADFNTIGGVGIKLTRCVDVRIANCTITDNEVDGIQAQDTVRCIQEHNTYTGNWRKATTIYCSAAASTNGNIVRNNTFTGNGRWGVSLDSNNTINDCYDTFIYENVFNGNGGSITVEDVSKVDIYKNTFGLNTLDTLDPDNVELNDNVHILSSENVNVYNNTFSESTGLQDSHINMKNSGTRSKNVRIEGNYFKGAILQIESLESGIDAVENLIIAGNYFTESSNSGIYIRDMINAYIADNLFYNHRWCVKYADVINGISLRNNILQVDSGWTATPGGQSVGTGITHLGTPAGSVDDMSANHWYFPDITNFYVSPNGNKGASNITDYDSLATVGDCLIVNEYPTASAIKSGGVNWWSTNPICQNGGTKSDIDISRGCKQFVEDDVASFHPLNL